MTDGQCPKHQNEYTGVLSDGTVGCRLCEHEEDELRQKRYKAERILSDLSAVTELGARNKSASFAVPEGGNQKHERIIGVVKKFADSIVEGKNDHWLCLHGLAGTGKTWLIGATCNTLIKGLKIPIYRSGRTFLDRVKRDAFKDGSESTVDQLIDRVFRSCDLLILDDFGAGFETQKTATDWSILFQIFDQAYRDERPLMIATNLDEAGFKSAVSDGSDGRIWDRCRQMMRAYKCDWKSLR